MKRIALFLIALVTLLGGVVNVKAATTGSVTADGKTVNYSYEFKESGSNVTFSITITSIKNGDNDATIDGLVNPAFYDGNGQLLADRSGAFAVSSASTYTWENLPADTVLQIRANYAYANAGEFNIPLASYTVVGGSTPSSPTNLALNGTTKATSGEASLAVDGGTTGGSRWESTQVDPQYWQVDLGSIQTFNTIKIVWEAAYGKTFTIEAGDNVDGEGWLTGGTTIASVTGQTLAGFPNTQTIYVGNTTAKYLKFNGIERGTGYGYSFWEFEVYNDASNAPTSITITGNNETLIGETLQFTASGTDAGSNVVTPGVTWSSSDTSVGTIDAKTGLFTGVAAGTTNITASLGGVTSNSITVTVINAVAPTDVPNIITSYNDGNETYTIDSDQLIKIFTVSGNATGFNNESHNVTITSTTINDKQVLKYENFKIAGAGFGKIALKDNMEYLHVDVYPMQPMTMAFFLNNGGHGKGAQRTLAVGEWNSLTIPLSEFNIPETTEHFIMAQNTNDSGAENPGGAIDNLTLYIGNIYYFKTESVPDTAVPEMVSATVSNVAGTTATLTVRANDDKVGGTITYKVYNGSVAAENLLTTGTGAAGADATINLTGLSERTTYNLVVTATDAASKTSADFAVAEFTTLFVTPVMQSATVSAVTKTEATVTVNATDDTAGTLTYNVYNGSATGTPLATATGTAGTNVVINLTGLTEKTTYNLVVTATDGDSHTSEPMEASSFRTLSSLKIWFNDGGAVYTDDNVSLEELITGTSYGNTQLKDVTELHIDGPLGGNDVNLLRQMAGGAPRIGNGNIKTRVYIKADYPPYLYAWKGDTKLLGVWPGTQLTEKVNGYYVYEFTDTDINITMNNGIGGQTSDINNLSGDNYFIYYNGDGHNGTGVTHEIGDYAHLGNLATLDLAEASFFQDGKTFVSRWENNAYLPCAFSNNHTNTFSVDGYMFYDCDKLQTVTLPTAASGNKQIGVYAFHDCDGLVTVNLPSDLVTIAGYAFENCENLGEVTLPSTLESIGYRAFCDSHKVTLHDAQLPNSITMIADLAFGNTSITEVCLPVNSGYTTVNGATFGWNGKLKTLVIPANVTTMNDGAFRQCGILDDVTIADDAVITSIGVEAFLADHALPSATANRLMRDITELRKGVFQECTSLDNINIPAAVTNIYDLAFAGCTGLNSVTVNSATAPDGYTVTDGKMVDNKNNKVDPFNNVNPNNLTLHFEGDALAGYKSYRSGTAESNTFKRLLTKTLGETATNYNVAGQMHADVVLNRTMKEGWNTVALPFGVKNGDAASEAGRDREGKAAQVYAAAFNVADGDGFMIATYRGEENGVFKFLKHGDYATYGFDEFEPLLIKMASSNLNAENKYTFVDVDLNYDTEQNKLYRENNADEAVPTKRWTGSEFVDFFGSNYNHDWEWFSRTTDGYAFTGTYYTQTSADVTAEGSFIKEGDYIIQNDMFYQVVSTKKYGMRGYRAWFHDRGVGTGAKPETLMFTVYERPEATEIDEPTDPDDPNEPIIVDKISAIDSLSITPQDIYTLGGQLVRKNATTVDGLAKGMYIMGGKKIVVE
jgi:hypothetical protein